MMGIAESLLPCAPVLSCNPPEHSARLPKVHRPWESMARFLRGDTGCSNLRLLWYSWPDSGDVSIYSWSHWGGSVIEPPRDTLAVGRCRFQLQREQWLWGITSLPSTWRVFGLLLEGLIMVVRWRPPSYNRPQERQPHSRTIHDGICRRSWFKDDNMSWHLHVRCLYAARNTVFHRTHMEGCARTLTLMAEIKDTTWKTRQFSEG